jgi:hypothetical protein
VCKLSGVFNVPTSRALLQDQVSDESFEIFGLLSIVSRPPSSQYGIIGIVACAMAAVGLIMML